jgi:hypothetical protein
VTSLRDRAENVALGSQKTENALRRLQEAAPLIAGVGPAHHSIDEPASILERTISRGPSDAHIEIVKNDTVDDERRAIATAHTGVPQIAPHLESLDYESQIVMLGHERRTAGIAACSRGRRDHRRRPANETILAGRDITAKQIAGKDHASFLTSVFQREKAAAPPPDDGLSPFTLRDEPKPVKKTWAVGSVEHGMQMRGEIGPPQ